MNAFVRPSPCPRLRGGAGRCEPRRGRQDATWAGRGDPQTMDPYSQNENLTNNINNLVYDALVMRDKDLKIIPALATSWEQVNPTTWRFKLRPGVKFHDGTPFTADDVVFSIERAADDISQIKAYARAVGQAAQDRRPDRRVRHRRAEPDRCSSTWSRIMIMSKSWSEKNKATKPLDFKNKEEIFTARNANGTGPYIAEDARARRADGARAQQRLVGLEGQEVRRQRHRGHLHADRQRRDAARRAGLRRRRPGQRPGAAGRAAAAADARRQGDRGLRAAHRVPRHGPGTATSSCTRRQGQESAQGQARPPGALPGDRHRRDPQVDDARPVEAHRRR